MEITTNSGKLTQKVATELRCSELTKKHVRADVKMDTSI